MSRLVPISIFELVFLPTARKDLPGYGFDGAIGFTGRTGNGPGGYLADLRGQFDEDFQKWDKDFLKPH